ncbi:bifunctional DNA-formamidopyrimidine glycosylase/DNA-(apurinic or apyrimidinic site) lyase [Saccharopolyspora indica]|uniref:bifunctional DNA-formamidopyrimidine glycosylase/DNA-(apurinic or apyrimidinic site) lyase n=1 Tax=Saccharopolyspora indica TaxID=1229659 RepID=UPI0022EB998C|nr:bifunctional DNA-formamidopyrimidine glycosylase/DNA-(apurinic or apyrimidinic site) lyase [Saccharopolyspora indica]MDA3643457.1 bifunctional DNA-formamidopyrimidine glycosylase/DNA-(apurinic or apyrimidinic site) lyase [Saccharopolyspora indica]
MPELPEVEVVRRGVAEHAIGRTVSSVEVLHPRAVRRHVPGPEDLAGRLAGRVLSAARRRGKYLWLELGDGEPRTSGGEALVVHLGMSGQLLVQPAEVPDEKHLRVRFRFADGGPELRFVDQRTFGGLHLADLVEVDGLALPEPIEHIAPDPLEESFDLDRLAERLRARRTGIKRALLDQSLVSGIGNIYADEALWRAKLHWARPTATLTRPKIRELFDGVTEVMQDALRAGGTSFDALYVNVNGESGYFDRSLAVYGQLDRPCPRCGAPIRRDAFMNRSSYTCPVCQPKPRNAHL